MAGLDDIDIKRIQQQTKKSNQNEKQSKKKVSMKIRHGTPNSTNTNTLAQPHTHLLPAKIKKGTEKQQFEKRQNKKKDSTYVTEKKKNLHIYTQTWQELVRETYGVLRRSRAELHSEDDLADPELPPGVTLVDEVCVG